MGNAHVSLAEFQAFIAERYREKDEHRGVARTFLWFMEEIGELASALQQTEESDADSDVDLAGEFADVLGWLTTLANMKNVDLTKALQRRYLNDGGRIHKI